MFLWGTKPVICSVAVDLGPRQVIPVGKEKY